MSLTKQWAKNELKTCIEFLLSYFSLMVVTALQIARPSKPGLKKPTKNSSMKSTNVGKHTRNIGTDTSKNIGTGNGSISLFFHCLYCIIYIMLK